MNIPYSPVIVVGMHRSGTSAFIRALSELGLFIGYDLEPNAEARYFLNLNEEMLSMAGARWDAPDSMFCLLEDDDLVAWLVQWLASKMHGFDTCLYLSKPNWLRYRDIRKYPKPWGWKDPRNSVTLPIWLQLFPQAKVIHVIRHGVDVAASLQVREKALREKTLANDYQTSSWKLTSPRCLDLTCGFKLWESYVSAVEGILAQLPDSQKLTLTFEDWLVRPAEHLAQLNAWLGLGAGDEEINRVIQKLNVDRRFAFQQSDELASFASSVCPDSQWIQRFYPEGHR